MKLSSKRWDKVCRVVFHNTGNEPVQMIWVDYEGKEQPFTVLNQGEKCCQQTFASHPFVMRLVRDQQIVAIFVPNDETVDYVEVQPGMFEYDKEKDGVINEESVEERSLDDKEAEEEEENEKEEVEEWTEEENEKEIEDHAKNIHTCNLIKASDIDWKSLKSTYDSKEHTEISIRNNTTTRYDVLRVDTEGNHFPHGYSSPISTFWSSSAYSGHYFLLKDEKTEQVEYVLKVTDKPTMYIVEATYVDYPACIEDEKQSSCRNILMSYSNKRIGPRKIGFNTPDIVNDMISELKKRNLKFVDEDFPPRSDCVRAQDLFKHPRVFKDISVKDAIQGSLGDCFLISSISGAALRPNLLKKVFYHCKYIDPQLGLYVVTFNLEPNNEKMTLLLDDYFPAENGNLKFAHSDDRGELWISLIEKAIAKLVGDYEKVNPLMNAHLIYPSNILSLLFGGRAKQLEWFTGRDSEAKEKMKNGTFWPLIEKLLDSATSVPVCATMPGEEGSDLVNKKGLVNYHGYSLLGYRKFPEHDLKLVNLRNTWGRTEYNGPWSDDSPEWNQYPDVKNAIQHESSDDGCFWMTYEAFENCFGVIWWNNL